MLYLLTKCKLVVPRAPEINQPLRIQDSSNKAEATTRLASCWYAGEKVKELE